MKITKNARAFSKTCGIALPHKTAPGGPLRIRAARAARPSAPCCPQQQAAQRPGNRVTVSGALHFFREARFSSDEALHRAGKIVRRYKRACGKTLRRKNHRASRPEKEAALAFFAGRLALLCPLPFAGCHCVFVLRRGSFVKLYVFQAGRCVSPGVHGSAFPAGRQRVPVRRWPESLRAGSGGAFIRADPVPSAAFSAAAALPVRR